MPCVDVSCCVLYNSSSSVDGSVSWCNVGVAVCCVAEMFHVLHTRGYAVDPAVIVDTGQSQTQYTLRASCRTGQNS